MFGIGYATAEDRLFFIDVLRHSGQGDLAQFAGGANVAMDEDVWANEPYTQQDLANQINWAAASSPDGPQILSDATNYVDGINAYIAKAESPLNALTMLPAEYAAIGQPQGPQPFTVEDLVSIATLVGGIFGNGGGQQLSNAVLYENMKSEVRARALRRGGLARAELAARKKKKPKKHKKKPRILGLASLGVRGGRAAGRPAAAAHSGRGAGAPVRHPRSRQGPARRRASCRTTTPGFGTFLSFDDPTDPEAPTTVHGKSFPYQTLPQAEQGRPEDDRPPRRRVGLLRSTRSSPAPSRPARAGQATTGSRSGPSSVTGLAGWPRAPAACCSSRARCRTRCW